MKKISNRRGQILNIGGPIIMLVVAATVLTLGIIMMSEIKDTDVMTQSLTSSVINESMTLNDTTQSVLKVGDRGSNNFAIISVVNATSGVTVPASNYTFTSTGTLKTKYSDYNGTSVKISYSYRHGDSAYMTANTTIKGLSSFGDFWEIIVLAIVISVVIGLLMIVFARRSGR